MKCRICGNCENNRAVEAREMMFGWRDAFRYFQCSCCLCLQIEEIPEDISRYYPADYYSYHSAIQANKLKKFLIRQRNRYALYGRNILGKFLYARHPSTAHQALHRLAVVKHARILDVGCGAGDFLFSLRELGMKNLLGIDPLNQSHIEYKNGLSIEKKTIHEVAGCWDVVMFHHSFEHISDPAETLLTVARLLYADGCCIIRTPTVSSYAWTHYGANWAQLDAPRHLFLHSVESMKILAGQAGLVVQDVVYDSTSFQFTGSERYVRDIPLQGEPFDSDIDNGALFSKKELAAFAECTKELNKTRQGDQAAFYLGKL